jgi:streptomycin 6-kinase
VPVPGSDLVPPSLDEAIRRHGEAGAAWLAGLPGRIEHHARQWEVELDGPLGAAASAAWVGGGRRADGSEVVLKLAWPHPEAATEAAGLRAYGGRGAVRLLECDEPGYALLLERCRPGTDLWALPTRRADEVVVDVLAQLWSADAAGAGTGIGTLADTVAAWHAAYPTTRRDQPGELVAEAVRVADELVASTADVVVLHGDANPSNVLAATRSPWLAIDPKPLIGDPAHDLAQYLANRIEEAQRSGDACAWMVERVRWFAAATGLDPVRIAGWAFAKSVGWHWGPDTATLLLAAARSVGWS